MRKTILIFFFAGIFTLQVNADSIWPFNSSYVMIKQLCKNSADIAERAARSRDKQYTLSDMLDGYSDPAWNKDPIDRLHKQVYIQATKLAFRNKSVSPDTIYDMQYDICYAKKEQFKKIISRMD
ncbi:hypothetical protein ACN08N_23460 [Photobacterium leiognathi subsp. mandapamensis]|uniref:hypothetical protein n=1 Tax=Photobacterium leiognathi TaxID=553611 RepID=UPI003AF3478C